MAVQNINGKRYVLCIVCGKKICEYHGRKENVDKTSDYCDECYGDGTENPSTTVRNLKRLKIVEVIK